MLEGRVCFLREKSLTTLLTQKNRQKRLTKRKLLRLELAGENRKMTRENDGRNDASD